MRTLNEQPPIRGLPLARPRVAWRRAFFVGFLFVLISLCLAAVTGSSALASSPAQQSLAGAANDGGPPHAADCAVNIEAAVRSTVGARDAWIGQPMGDAVWFVALDRPAVGPPDRVAVRSAAVRRALLQIFLI